LDVVFACLLFFASGKGPTAAKEAVLIFDYNKQLWYLPGGSPKTISEIVFN